MLKVMIVDDDSMVYRIVKTTIPWEKYQMSVEEYAPNGLKAIEYLSMNHIDILFVDLSMPHMGGIELIQRVHEYLPQTIFVILSSHSEYRLVKESFCIGAFDYLLKVDVDDETVVNELLRRVSDKLCSMKKDGERLFDQADLISKLEPENGEKTEFLYKVQVLSLKEGENRLKAAEELRSMSENVSMVFGCYEGYIVVLHYAKDKKKIEKQVLNLDKRLLKENESILSSGASKIDSYTEIDNLYAEAVRNIDDGFSRIKEYLKQNYDRPELSLQVVADELNINKRMVSRYISDRCGLMFKGYLNEIRICMAKDKLRISNMRIQEVAYACGYTNVEHFTRIFTEKMGCSPSQYIVYGREEVYHVSK